MEKQTAVLFCPGRVANCASEEGIWEQLGEAEHQHWHLAKLADPPAERLFADKTYQQNYHATDILHAYLAEITNHYESPDSLPDLLLLICLGDIHTQATFDWTRARRTVDLLQRLPAPPFEVCLLHPRSHTNAEFPLLCASVVSKHLGLVKLNGWVRGSPVMLLSRKYLERLTKNRFFMEAQPIEEWVSYTADLGGLVPGILGGSQEQLPLPERSRDYTAGSLLHTYETSLAKEPIVVDHVRQDVNDKLAAAYDLERQERVLFFDYHAHCPKERDSTMYHVWRYFVWAFPHLRIHYTHHYPNAWPVPIEQPAIVFVSQYAVQENPALSEAGFQVVNLVSNSNYLSIYRGNMPAEQLSKATLCLVPKEVLTSAHRVTAHNDVPFIDDPASNHRWTFLEQEEAKIIMSH